METIVKNCMKFMLTILMTDYLFIIIHGKMVVLSNLAKGKTHQMPLTN